MDSALPVMEEIRSPLSVVQRLFKASKAGAPWDPSAHFASALAGSWHQVPLLNDVQAVEQLAPGSLVRFRCMVQNVYNPEWYDAEYDLVSKDGSERIRMCGHFSDTMESIPGYTADTHADSASMQDRLPLHCMSIPGESTWVRSTLRGPAPPTATATPTTTNNNSRGKRSLEPEGDESMEMMIEVEGTCVHHPNDDSNNNKDKRVRGEANASGHACCAAGGCEAGCGGVSSGVSPVKVAGGDVQHAAIVKLYGAHSSDAVKVNDLVEFIGILAVDPVLAEFPENKDGEMSDAIQQAFSASGPPPSSVVPRIHALCFNKIASMTWMPSIDTLPEATRASSLASVTCHSSQIRDSLVRRFAASLGGDALCAEYVMLNVLSGITARINGSLIGKLTLGICGLPPSVPKGGSQLSDTLSRVLPLVSYLPLTVSSLNSAPLAPKKNYTTEMLHTGPLQLAAGTQLVIDETTMEAGQLKDTGCKNLMALQALVQEQKIPFDFSYYNVNFETDVPVIVTAQAKPLVPVNCLVKIQPTAEPNGPTDGNTNNASSHHVETSPEEDHLCRIYLGTARALARDVEIPEDVCNAVQASFVQARQQDSKVCQETLELWLTLARLLAASYMEKTLTVQRWHQVLEMETRRVAA